MNGRFFSRIACYVRPRTDPAPQRPRGSSGFNGVQGNQAAAANRNHLCEQRTSGRACCDALRILDRFKIGQYYDLTFHAPLRGFPLVGRCQSNKLRVDGSGIFSRTMARWKGWLSNLITGNVGALLNKELQVKSY